jgi:hypothetical protein
MLRLQLRMAGQPSFGAQRKVKAAATTCCGEVIAKTKARQGEDGLFRNILKSCSKLRLGTPLKKTAPLTEALFLSSGQDVPHIMRDNGGFESPWDHNKIIRNYMRNSIKRGPCASSAFFNSMIMPSQLSTATAGTPSPLLI